MESWWVPAPAERRRNVTLVSGAAVLPSLGCSHSYGAPISGCTAGILPFLGCSHPGVFPSPGCSYSCGTSIPRIGFPAIPLLGFSHSWDISIPVALPLSDLFPSLECFHIPGVLPLLGFSHSWGISILGTLPLLGFSYSWGVRFPGHLPLLGFAHGFFPSLGCSWGVQPRCDPLHPPFSSHRTVPRALHAAWHFAAHSTASSALLC